jgi:hypothetical protein
LFLCGEDPKGIAPGDRTALGTLSGDRGREKIIGFVAWASAPQSRNAHELQRDLELFAQLGIEVTPILVISERVMPTGGSLERIPPNKNGARAFVFLEALLKTRKFDDCH